MEERRNSFDNLVIHHLFRFYSLRTGFIQLSVRQKEIVLPQVSEAEDLYKPDSPALADTNVRPLTPCFISVDRRNKYSYKDRFLWAFF
jgi:hypothetical protein